MLRGTFLPRKESSLFKKRHSWFELATLSSLDPGEQYVGPMTKHTPFVLATCSPPELHLDHVGHCTLAPALKGGSEHANLQHSTWKSGSKRSSSHLAKWGSRSTLGASLF